MKEEDIDFQIFITSYSIDYLSQVPLLSACPLLLLPSSASLNLSLVLKQGIQHILSRTPNLCISQTVDILIDN